MKIGFIGLGVMGNLMAANLVKVAEHEISVFDLDPSRVDSRSGWPDRFKTVSANAGN